METYIFWQMINVFFILIFELFFYNLIVGDDEILNLGIFIENNKKKNEYGFFFFFQF